MSQATLDDDDLFGEAAGEITENIESSLDAATAAIPDTDSIWTVEAENTLGVLNGLKGAFEVDDAESHLREAKKWFVVGKRADLFEDPDDIEAEIETIESLMEQIETAQDQVSALTRTLPEIRSTVDSISTESAQSD